jgi:hypothetical protein
MIGPALPPHLRKKSADVGEEERKQNSGNSEEDDYGPALPPGFAARRAGPKPVDVTPARTEEPTRQSNNRDDEYDDDDDDIIGPQLPSSIVAQDPEDGVREFLEREQRRKELAEVSAPLFTNMYSPNACTS